MLLDRGTPQFLRVRRKRTTAVGECGGNPRNRGINWIIMLEDSKGREKYGREMDRKVFWGSLTIEYHQAYNNSRRDGGRLKYFFWFATCQRLFSMLCLWKHACPACKTTVCFVDASVCFKFYSKCVRIMSQPLPWGIKRLPDTINCMFGRPLQCRGRVEPRCGHKISLL